MKHYLVWIFGAALLLPPTALAGNAVAAKPVTRCGWLVNPTPGNWWLTDSQGDWIIATQGSDQEASGMELIGDISEHDYQRINGNHGYACACMKVADDPANKRIVAIESFRQLPLHKCRADKSLPSPD